MRIWQILAVVIAVVVAVLLADKHVREYLDDTEEDED